jgi:LemA protein
MIFVVVAVAVIVAFLAFGVVGYNGLVRKRNRMGEAWSQIDVELKRRHSLIPNLVETVRGYAAHEHGVLDAVTAARAAAVSAGSTRDAATVASAENQLGQSLRSLFAVAENYPQLRAVESFRQLQEELTATEDKIEYARRYYNGSVRDYDTALQTFPRNLIARTFSFRDASFFMADQDDRQLPAVDLAGGPSRSPKAPGEIAESPDSPPAG